jgi:hypothetical protein
MRHKLIALMIVCMAALGLSVAPAWAQSSGQAQTVKQGALTVQGADADANATQNAVNANVPVVISGGGVSAGSSSANQNAGNAANASAQNTSLTLQAAQATQTGGGSSCYAGCGGGGQYQAVGQAAGTVQSADADADAKQNAVNANVPVTIAGGDVKTGSSSATQKAENEADADAKNGSLTIQAVEATQTGGGSSCKKGCGGSGQYQAVGQAALTAQDAEADADAKQNAVNGNAPVTIAGGDVKTGSSSATQNAENEADADAKNASGTIQLVSAEQTGGGSSCYAGCGGSGQYQAVGQLAVTHQDAKAEADADQNAVNGNAPVAIAGGDVETGDSKAEQDVKNEADADAKNGSLTIQAVEATQTGGGSCKSKCYSPCKYGCGGDGQAQEIGQVALTAQDAKAEADADQNAVNGNAPVAIAGDDVKTGDSKAEQDAKNEADAEAANGSLTIQAVEATQSGGSSCKSKCYDSCKSGCGGSGQSQKVGQLAATFQDAKADADADQNAVNGNAPVAIAGDDVETGDSKAEQDAKNEADAKAENGSLTVQLAGVAQTGGGSCKDRCSDPCRDKYKKPCKDKRDDGCKSGCGSQGQLQKILQLSLTKQKADADADANQNAVNGNAPVAIAGDDVKTGDSKAEQDAENEANAKAKNKSLTAQLAFAWQSLR